VIGQFLVESLMLSFLGGAMGLLLAHAAIAMMVRSWPWAIPTPRSLFTMYRRSSSRSPIRLLLPVEMDAGRQKALEQVCATAQNDAVQSVELKADSLEAKSSPAQQSYNLLRDEDALVNGRAAQHPARTRYRYRLHTRALAFS
jgi:hypothetical protein